YNSGTGVVISHRRRGIAMQLMQRSIEKLPAKRYILEVIETNERAASLYRQLGFAETRRFQCWMYGGQTILSVRTGRIACPPLQSDWLDMQHSWQNSLASLRRAHEPFDVLCY